MGICTVAVDRQHPGVWLLASNGGAENLENQLFIKFQVIRDDCPTADNDIRSFKAPATPVPTAASTADIAKYYYSQFQSYTGAVPNLFCMRCTLPGDTYIRVKDGKVVKEDSKNAFFDKNFQFRYKNNNIVCEATGQSIENGGGATGGDILGLYKDDNSDNKKWDMKSKGDGVIILVNRASGRYLDVNNVNAQTVDHVIYNGMRLENAEVSSTAINNWPFFFRLKSKIHGTYLRVSGRDLKTNNLEDGVDFVFHVEDNNLINITSNLSIETGGGATGMNGVAQIIVNDGNSNKKWTFESKGDAGVFLRSQATGKYITAPTSATGTVTVEDLSSGRQGWIIEATSRGDTVPSSFSGTTQSYHTGSKKWAWTRGSDHAAVLTRVCPANSHVGRIQAEVRDHQDGNAGIVTRTWKSINYLDFTCTDPLNPSKVVQPLQKLESKGKYVPWTKTGNIGANGTGAASDSTLCTDGFDQTEGIDDVGERVAGFGARCKTAGFKTFNLGAGGRTQDSAPNDEVVVGFQYQMTDDHSDEISGLYTLFGPHAKGMYEKCATGAETDLWSNECQIWCQENGSACDSRMTQLCNGSRTDDPRCKCFVPASRLNTLAVPGSNASLRPWCNLGSCASTTTAYKTKTMRDDIAAGTCKSTIQVCNQSLTLNAAEKAEVLIGTVPMSCSNSNTTVTPGAAGATPATTPAAPATTPTPETPATKTSHLGLYIGLGVSSLVLVVLITLLIILLKR